MEINNITWVTKWLRNANENIKVRIINEIRHSPKILSALEKLICLYYLTTLLEKTDL